MAHDPKTYRYFLLALDPVHVGTGGTRLGRVDMDIVREPGTRLPKIPGTSLHGAIRSYAAHRYGKPHCAGQGQEEGRKHCGQPTCPICYTFGYVRDKDRGHAGVVAIGDARILLFPVYSMVGPVWVTSSSALADVGFGKHTVSPGRAKWGGQSNGELPTDKPINLGWLMVEREGDLPGIQWLPEISDEIKNRVVLVSDKLFSQIVNSNLEVRTSVAINPETGAAEEGALFTYEAIPRATVLWMDVVVSDYRKAFPSKERLEKWLRRGGKDFSEDERPSRKDLAKAEWNDEQAQDSLAKYEAAGLAWETPVDLIVDGLAWAEHLGVGGMGTRGFGRIRHVVRYEVTNNGVLEKCEKENSHGDTESTGM